MNTLREDQPYQSLWIQTGRGHPSALRVPAHIAEVGPNRVNRVVPNSPWDREAVWTIGKGEMSKEEANRLLEARIRRIQECVICGIQDHNIWPEIPGLPGLPCENA